MLSTNGIELNEINAAQLPSDRASSIQSRYLVSALYIYRIYIYIYMELRAHIATIAFRVQRFIFYFGRAFYARV